MADFTFDGPNKLIIEPAGAGDTQFQVGRDLYSAWKRWVASGSGPGFEPAFSVEGGTPIGATGLFTGSTIIMTNGWKVRAAEHDHQVTLAGNLFSDDGVISVPSVSANATVFVAASVGAQGISTGSGLTSEQETKLGELHGFMGLDASRPKTATTTSIAFGDVAIDLTGDGTTTSTATRQ